MAFVNIGFGNIINSDKIVSIVSPEAAPIKRLVQVSKDEGHAIDATCGRKTKSVIVMENYCVVLSSLLPDTIGNRINQERMKGENEYEE